MTTTGKPITSFYFLTDVLRCTFSFPECDKVPNTEMFYVKFSYQRNFSTYKCFQEDHNLQKADFSKKRKYCDLGSRILNNLIKFKSRG